jgi:methylmalonyl-CoA mutase N-terminal domain/subunit
MDRTPHAVKQSVTSRPAETPSKTHAPSAGRKERFTSPSGDEIRPLYTALDLGEGNLDDRLGSPGSYPFTRGVQPSMYRGRLWTMRQYAGFATAEESNRRYRYLLTQGQTGLSVAFDLPTQLGYDSDDPLCEGEVGKVGVAIDTLADVETLFDQIPLGKTSVSMTINSTAAVLLSMLKAVADKQGVAGADLRGTIQNDILKEYIARGTYIFPPRPSMRLITDIFSWCNRELPQFNTISVSGYHMREAGCTAGQEVGFTLADGIAYVQAAIDAGLDVDQFAGQMSFFFCAHNDLFAEVAKFRAARRLWAAIMKERFGATTARAQMLRFHTQTAGCTLTAQQPDNNVVRVALQALAAVLGGTQSLHTNSRDEALALPTEQSARLALRTQQVIANESGAADTVDPLAGSYYVEALTDEIEARARAYLKEIDEMGGMVVALERGWAQREIQDAAYRYQQEVEIGSRPVVGVNCLTMNEPPPTNLLRVDPAVAEAQVARLKGVRAKRDNKAVQLHLAALDQAARGTDNLMEPIGAAARAYASIGEICGVLRRVFGEYRGDISSF